MCILGGRRYVEHDRNGNLEPMLAKSPRCGGQRATIAMECLCDSVRLSPLSPSDARTDVRGDANTGLSLFE